MPSLIFLQMRRMVVVFFASALTSTALYSQHASTHFRSADNPYYWKNKLPRQGYWQQDVHYQIEAKLFPDEQMLECNRYALTYWNNSPHTLSELYFHLFQNAFIPGSYYERLYLDKGKTVAFGPLEKTGKGTAVYDVKVNGRAVTLVLDNTIALLSLPTPLSPGDSVLVELRFTTWFDQGEMRRRMKVIQEGTHKTFGAVFWYPSVCVYDEKMGWNTDQHLDKEFYHDFGSFDVQLTLPAHYTAEATGLLVNSPLTPEEWEQCAMPSTPQPTGKNLFEPPLTENPGKSRVWHWKAINVHNFAFTAGPLFWRADTVYRSVQVVALARSITRNTWNEALSFVCRILESGERNFGTYAWPKLVIADVQDGMEYPMITFVGGAYPGCKGLLTHEIGHMWFYGMVGSNETYRAALDEGFTQFFTAYVMDELQTPRRPFMLLKQYNFPYNQQFVDAYLGYMSMRKAGQDAPLNTHSSDFNEGIRHDGGYGQVYFKTATMLYNLKYVLGDSLFFAALRHYVLQWSFCHPYPEDFRQSIQAYTKVNLSWFFDQWMETTKFTDYGIVAVGRKKQHPDTFQILLKRHGTMQMPIELAVLDKDGKVHRYYIPNGWFVKQGAGIVQKHWYGWSRFNMYYLLEVRIPKMVDRVVIDPSYSLADMDMLDNQIKVQDNRLTELAEPTLLNPAKEAAEQRKKEKVYGIKKAPK